jgi:hypothetical protein
LATKNIFIKTYLIEVWDNFKNQFQKEVFIVKRSKEIISLNYTKISNNNKPFKTKKTASFEAVFVPGAGIETPQSGNFNNLPKTVHKTTINLNKFNT